MDDRCGAGLGVASGLYGFQLEQFVFVISWIFSVSAKHMPENANGTLAVLFCDQILVFLQCSYERPPVLTLCD